MGAALGAVWFGVWTSTHAFDVETWVHEALGAGYLVGLALIHRCQVFAVHCAYSVVRRLHAPKTVRSAWQKVSAKR